MNTENSNTSGLINSFIIVDNETPEHLGTGKVVATLGNGGAATVFEIWNSRLEIKRAVKLWRPGISEKNLGRFENEIKISAKLRHPNIVEIHSVGEWNGLPFIEMEKIDGISLEKMMKDKGLLPLPVTLSIALMICKGLDYSHRQRYELNGTKQSGIIHCDLKPANVMIARDGIVKIMDFGIATPSNSLIDQDSDTVNGTLQYLSPEQLSAKPVDPRTDIFSLGVILYELFSGKMAFPLINTHDLVRRRMQNNFKPLQDITATLPKPLYDLVERCMFADPEKRFQTVAEIIPILEKVHFKLTKAQPETITQLYISGIKKFPAPEKKTGFYILIGSTLIATLLVGIGSSLFFFSLRQSKSTTLNEVTPIIVQKTDTIVLQNSQYTNDEETIVLEESTPKIDTLRSIPKNEKPLPATPATVSKKTRRVPLNEPAKLVNTDINQEPQTKIENEIIASEPSKEQQLLLMRSLYEKRDYSALATFFNNQDIADGEFFLFKARYFLSRGRSKAASDVLAKVLSNPSDHLSPQELRRQYFYTRALCLSADFDQLSGASQGNNAMEAWFDLKYQLRSSPNDPIYQHADREIRRISSIIKDIN